MVQERGQPWGKCRLSAKEYLMLKTTKNTVLYTGIALTVLIAAYSLRYMFDGADSVASLSGVDAVLQHLSREESTFWRDFSISQRPLYHLSEFSVVGHIGAASIALIAGIVQLLPFIRSRAPLLHRASGYLYAFTAILGLGLGAYISFTLPMVGGNKAITSNVIGGMLGISFVVISFIYIWKKEYVKHGQWMLRSYATLMTILTVYLLIGLFSLLRFDPELGYGLAHAICFPINLFIAEMIIRRSFDIFAAADSIQAVGSSR